jgi:hypothetical protein
MKKNEMKKQDEKNLKAGKKLSLSKETLRRLDAADLAHVVGGDWPDRTVDGPCTSLRTC